MGTRIYQFRLRFPDKDEEDKSPVQSTPISPSVVRKFTVRVLFDPSYNGSVPNDLVRVNGSTKGLQYTPLGRGMDRLYTYSENTTGNYFRVSFASVTGYVKPSNIKARGNGNYEVTYIKREPKKPKLTIRTEYVPTPANPFSKGAIYVNGDLVGIGRVELSLNKGVYNISFGDIQVNGFSYKTPKPVRVSLSNNESQTVTGIYEGKRLPPAYWLKPIEDVDSKYIAVEKIEGLFSNDIRNLTTMFTGSMTSSMENYTVDVYHEAITVPTSSIQFSLSYGHRLGYGSDNEDNNNPNNTPTKAIYGQYRNKILENSSGRFNLTGQETDHFYVINYQQGRLGNALDFGAFEINLATLSGSQFISGSGTKATHTGSNVTLAGDDSVIRLVSATGSDVGVYGYSYDIVSGTIEDGVYNASDPHVYGKLYSNHGVVLLDASTLDQSASFGTVDLRETDGDNFLKLYTSISGAVDLTDASGDLLGMKARRKVIEFNDFFFIRVGNEEFNRSNNSTYYSGSEGEISDTDLKYNPTTYITTIGLYNDNRELLAVCKLPKPVKKNYTTERLFKIRLKH